MSKKLSLVLFISLLVVALLVLAGCEDRYNFGDDYVEVTALRISTAEVSLSPTGDTQKYQLEVEIMPSNATNRMLYYYVPTEYSDYLTVDENGLITARKVTPAGVKVPIKVVSTTNKNAYLTVNVVVEDATVKSFYFEPSEIELEYKGEGYQLEPIFEPRHAQDGRQLSYLSLDENVCTVSSSGYVTPVGAGNATIVATSTSLAGTSVKGRVTVKVRYAPGQYRLDVSDAAPQYNQVIGDFKPIKFNLEVLNERSNPNIKIYWYVDSVRIPEADGTMQYEHTPSGETTNRYTVKVEVRAQNEQPWVAESHVISLYYPFDGFSLTVGNYSDQRDGYMYGDEASFNVTEGSDLIKKYSWYLRRRGETGKGVFLCENASTIKTLVRKLNLEGDFVLTVIGTDKDGVQLMTREYEFSATKFVVGDTLLLDPVQRNGGVPPESYNYYIYSCDENGVIDESTKRYIGSSGEGARFQYALNVAGTYKIFSEAILNGIVAQVNGHNFGYFTDVIKVYDNGQTLVPSGEDMLGAQKLYDRYRSTGNSDVENVTIEGIKQGEEDKVLVRWTPVSGVCAYHVEITKADGTVNMMDTDGVDATCFGNNYVIIPTEYVTLNDVFSIRIKHKGGDFSTRYYYGSGEPDNTHFGKVSADKYNYLAPVSGVTNLYIVSMRELGELLNYVILNQPVNNSLVPYAMKTVESVSYKTFTLNFYPAFDLADSNDYYPIDVEPGEVSDDLADVYKAVFGAQKAFCPAGSYRYDFAWKTDGSYTVTVYIANGETTVLHTDSVAHTKAASTHFSTTPYGSEYDNYAIDIRKKVRVADSEQLFRAVSDGYGVTFANDSIRILYEHAKQVVYTIIGPEMTDYEKALAFFDYLATDVIYDTELAGMSEDTVGLERYAGFKLEGVFNYHQAVCDGISKAYLLLCAIEGIECVRVTGTVNGNNHAWNKINIGGEWLVVDVTNGSLNQNGKLYANHAYFAVSNEEYLDLFPSVEEYGEYPVSDEGKSYYENAEINGFIPLVHNQAELDAIINSFDRAAGLTQTEIEIKFDVYFAFGSTEIAEKIAAINNVSANNLSDDVIIIGDDRAIITLI